MVSRSSEAERESKRLPTTPIPQTKRMGLKSREELTETVEEAEVSSRIQIKERID